jgi:hypothetical protein
MEDVNLDGTKYGRFKGFSMFQNDFQRWGWGDRLAGCDDVYELSIVLFDFRQDDSNHIKSNQPQ